MSLGLPPFSGGIGASFKILEILEYACYRSDCYAVGFKLGTAANLNQNPIFEMASNYSILYRLLNVKSAITAKKALSGLIDRSQ